MDIKPKICCRMVYKNRTHFFYNNKIIASEAGNTTNDVAIEKMRPLIMEVVNIKDRLKTKQSFCQRLIALQTAAVNQ